MELKKSPKADLENKRSIFLEIGIIVALAACIGMFSWSQKERVVEIVEQTPVVVETEMTEVTVQEDKRPPAPMKTQAVVLSDLLNVVKNDAKIEQTMNILDLDVTTDLAVDVTQFGGTYTGEGEVEEEEPVIIAETMPSFQGGDINAFAQWCGKHIVYPAAAADNGSQGKVIVQFVVERDGSISHVTILRGVDKFLDEEAMRVVKSSPKWSPGANRGKPVRVYVQVPINFVLE
ncbi:MAG TPA: TonB family protein [Candidatus Rikenella faecigallinarum]|uniref:TonB family protein n=1 Tax=Candidatus Rikenella faecigallinarum TaxID=2838745 RepID=A0A9D1QFP2_9BACT|nr:TonB family protein [Candidatus Rikenella faecigallinarum]